MVFEPAPGSTPAQASASASGFPQSHISGEPEPEDNGVGGFGVLGRVGHVAGATIERSQSITYLDLSPFMFVEDTYLFGDARLFLTNSGHMGGSAGLGVRQYFPGNDFVLGGSAWYDQDDSRSATFRQLGMSFELFSKWLDVRSNYYTAIGQNVRELGTTFAPGTAAFNQHQITFQTQTALSTGADMVDLMFTVPVPGEIAQSVNLEASAGWYQVFTPSIKLKDVNGYKLRMDADFLDRLVHGYTELSQDSVFGTNLVVAADVNYWHHLESRPRFGSSQYNRIAQWVRRNRNVVTIDASILNAPQAAINPTTGLEYFVNHVRNLVPPGVNFPAPTGNGTVETPFQFIPEAQGGAADLIFVHADSVFDNQAPLVLNDGELILGEGVVQAIPVQGLATPLPLPRATGGADRPLFINTAGTAVTLANNNVFAGFDITDTQGTAIFGSSISGGALRDIRITNTTGANAHGIHFENTAGTIGLTNVDVRNTQGNAFFVDGGTSTIIYDSGIITNSSGFAVLVQNNSGTVNLTGVAATDNGGSGVLVTDSSGSTTLGSLTLRNIIGDAIGIENVSGAVTMFSDVLIENAIGDGIHIENLTGGVSALRNIDINGRRAVGVNLLNIAGSGSVAFSGDVTMGTPALVGIDPEDHGINFQASEGVVSFTTVSINGSNGAGINIGDRAGNPLNVNTGQFIAQSTVNIDSAALSSIQVLNDSSRVRFNGIVIGNRSGIGIEVLDHSGTTNFASLNRIRNELDVGLSAVDVQISSGTVNFGDVIAENTQGPNPGVQILDNTGSVGFTGLSVESIQTTAVDIERNTSVNIGGGTLLASGARAITMIDNEAFGVMFDAVNSTDFDYGIFVDNDIALFDHPGSFTVLGNGATTGTGGTISGQTLAGASFNNVRTVNLQFMSFLDNLVGIETNDVTTLTVFGNEVSGSGSYGLNAVDTPTVLIEQNLFDSNEGENQIRIRGNRVLNPLTTPTQPSYNVTIRNNIVTDSTNVAAVGTGVQSPGGTRDMIYISNSATANNSSLQLLVENNGRTNAGGLVGFNSNRAFGDAVIGTRWNGDILATFQNNNIRMSDLSGQVGTRLVSTRSTAVNDVLYQGNVFNDGGGSQEVGLFMDFSGTANLQILNNFGVDSNGNAVVDGFTMDGDADVLDRAIDLVFRSTNNAIDISRNRITFNSNVGTGVLFQAISGPSTVNMDGNTITLFDQNFFVQNEVGIRFQTVVGNITLSSLAGQNNVIVPSNVPNVSELVIPAGVSTGSFLINNQRLP